MAYTYQNGSFYDPTAAAGQQYYLPQIMGGSGQGQAFGVGGMTGTMGVPTGNLSAAPSSFDLWAAQGLTNPNTGFVQNTTMPTSGDQPGMPTGQGWYRSSPFATTPYDQTDKGAFGLAGMPGMAIMGPMIGAGLAGAGAFSGLGGASSGIDMGTTDLGIGQAGGTVAGGGGLPTIPGLDQVTDWAPNVGGTQVAGDATGIGQVAGGGIPSLPPVATGMPGADVIGAGTGGGGLSMSDLTGGVLTDSTGGSGGFLKSILDPINSALGTNIGPGNVIGSALQALFSQNTASKLQGVANQAINTSSILDPTQRAAVRQQATNLATNPKQFMSSDPFVQALTQQMQRTIPAQVAKSGNPGQVIDQAGSQFATAVGQEYTGVGNMLTGMLNPGYSGIASTQPAAVGALVGSQGIAGMGNLFGQQPGAKFTSPFASTQQPASPFGTTIS